MYNWRITSFVLFGFMFWLVSMLSTSLVWIALAYLFSGKGKGQGDKAIKPETPDDETSIKDEDEDEDRGGLSRFPPDNDSEEENARPEPASTSETEDASHARDIGHGGMGTGVESAGDRGVQRRRSRMFEGEQS